MDRPGPNESSPRIVDERAPALTLAVALAAGIVLDRLVALPGWLWTAAALACLVAVIGARRHSAFGSAAAAVGLFVCLGGARHHQFWSLRPSDHLLQYARDEPRPVELVGELRTPVEIIPAEQDAFTPTWMRVDRSLCEVDAAALLSAGSPVPTTGRLRLEVSGHLLHVRAGDRVRLLGALVVPGPPRNPGGYDFRAWLRGRGVDCVLRCDHPDAVTLIEPADGAVQRLRRWRDGARRACLDILQRRLQPPNVPVAASLLLGDRSGMTDELRDAFVHSGTMHLLAISGLHVGLLAGMVYLGCRLLGLSAGSTGLVVLVAIVGYAFLADHRPPVVRAAILAAIVVVAGPNRRRAPPLNTLNCSALVVLLWNPADLFDVGAQLSFLAVLGILCGSRLAAVLRRIPRDRLHEPPGRVQRLGRSARHAVADAYLVTGGIWLFTLPATLHRFHLAAPVGFVVNVLLVPYSALLLASGFLLIGCGLLLPEAAAWPGWLFERLLDGLRHAVAWSAATPLGHFSVAGPPAWWLAGFYLGLAVAVGMVRLPFQSSRAWLGLAVWVVVGLAWPLAPAARDGLRCTVLAVGHGEAVLLELPGGRAVLYDLGAFGAPERAERVAQHALWAAGIGRLDALIVSHADSDHYNGASGLLQAVPVSLLLLSQASLDFRQEGMAQLCDDAARARTDIRLIWQGDRLHADPDVELEVLHPPPGPGHAADNANSVVLRVRYAGRTLLLTGDIEGQGLAELLRQAAEPVDVLLAPHHGARDANSPELAAWCRPRVVVVSTGDRRREAALDAVYGADCRILSTATSGAVTITIDSAGVMRVDEFVPSPAPAMLQVHAASAESRGEARHSAP